MKNILSLKFIKFGLKLGELVARVLWDTPFSLGRFDGSHIHNLFNRTGSCIITRNTGSKTNWNSFRSEMNAALSAGDNRPSGCTCTDSTEEEGGTVNLVHGLVAWVEEGSVEDSRRVRCAWHTWSFLRRRRGSSVLLRSLSLPPMD